MLFLSFLRQIMKSKDIHDQLISLSPFKMLRDKYITKFVNLLFIVLKVCGNVIENGDFESGDLDPWSCTHSDCIIDNGYLCRYFADVGTLTKILTCI